MLREEYDENDRKNQLLQSAADKKKSAMQKVQNEQEKAFVQGDENALQNGQRVVIIYGDVIRIMPYEE